MSGPATAARGAVAVPSRDRVPPLVRTELAARAMGGRLGVHVASVPGHAAVAARDVRLVAGRVRAWSRLITRHEPGSPLLRLNDDPRTTVPVPPTLGAVLAWAVDAGRMTAGLVDVTRLDERLAAEHGDDRGVPHGPGSPATRTWSLDLRPSRRAAITRAPGTRFDLDGVGKGWLADRALHLLEHHPGAMVDADGDIAVRIAPGDRWEIGVADPRTADALLALIVLADEPAAPGRGRRAWGVATSGTTIHRFGATAHHLIDPRTGRPATTDVVQATVISSGAATAEAFAKSAVILGSGAGLGFLDRSGVAGAILLLQDGRVLAIPRTLAFLA